MIPTARIQRGPSNSLYLSLKEWPRLPFTARMGRAQFHRARSASKKGTWPLLPLPSKLARFSFHGMAPVLVPLRPSSEGTDDPSKLARYFFRDGGCLIF